MTLKEIKEYIESWPEWEDTNTNIGSISLIKEGSMDPYFKFHIQEKSRPDYKITMKKFYDMLIERREIIKNVVTNIVSVKVISTGEKVINDSNKINLAADLIAMFETSKNNDDKTLTGQELIELLSEWPETFRSFYKTNIENVYLLSEGNLRPKLFINRPDLADTDLMMKNERD